MLQIERVNDREEALRVALEGFGANLWTAIPGIVLSYNAAQGTVSVQPSIQSLITAPDGTSTYQDVAPLTNIPVVFMGGGAFVATFPIQAGDEALIILADRCIDAWWQSGGVQGQAEPRMHDIHDGFALIGPRSLARSIPNLSTTTAQFRTLDGSAYYELAPGGVANIVAPGGLNIRGPVNIAGDVNVTGTVEATEEGTFNSIPVSTHLHPGVQSGASDTGGPIP